MRRAKSGKIQETDDYMYPVLDVVPHGKAMSLLDSIVACDDDGLQASLRITEQSPFFDGNGVPAWVGIEYMGQAIAAFAGIADRKRKRAIKIGFLVGSRRYESNCAVFPLGAQLQVSVSPLTDHEEGLRVFACTIKGVASKGVASDASELATTLGTALDSRDEDIEAVSVSANLNVFSPDNVEEFLQDNS